MELDGVSLGIARRYRDTVKLDDGRMRYIIRARENGNNSKDIAYSLSG
jgi:hypothetical protein